MMKRYIPRPRTREYVTVLLLVLEIVVMGAINQNIFSNVNISQVISNAAEMALICIGMNMVMLLGGIDLSVGGIMGLSALAGGYMLQAGGNSFAVIAVTVAVGCALGLGNGLLITKFRIPDLVATLATMNIMRAAIFGLLGGNWLTGLLPDYSGITTAKAAGVPVIIFLIVALYAVFYWLTNFTAFGRKLSAVGTNEKAATLCGISPANVKRSAYMILGALTGFAGALYIARMGAVEMQVGVNLHTECIAAVVVGGMGMGGVGGKSTLLGTLAGVFFITFMRNGIVILGIPSLLENFVIGLLIVVSLAADVLITRAKARADAKKQMANIGGDAL